jgi:hypothetical protein
MISRLYKYTQRTSSRGEECCVFEDFGATVVIVCVVSNVIFVQEERKSQSCRDVPGLYEWNPYFLAQLIFIIVPVSTQMEVVPVTASDPNS